MMDVALTRVYDVCLFNGAAQVLFGRSGQGYPSESVWVFTSEWLEVSQRSVVPSAQRLRNVSWHLDKCDDFMHRLCPTMVVKHHSNPSGSVRTGIGIYRVFELTDSSVSVTVRIEMEFDEMFVTVL